jgi:hypothetical protein
MPQVNPWGRVLFDQSSGLQPDEALTQSKGNVINIRRGEYGANTGALPINSDPNDVLQILSGLALDGTSEEEMANTPHDDQLLDAKLGRAAAETDTKFAQLLGRIDSSNAEVKGEIKALSAHFTALERSTSGVKATIIATAAVGIAIVIAILGYGQQWFGIVMSTRYIVRQTVQEMQLPPVPPKPH